jgi:hypothetical protein
MQHGQVLCVKKEQLSVDHDLLPIIVPTSKAIERLDFG